MPRGEVLGQVGYKHAPRSIEAGPRGPRMAPKGLPSIGPPNLAMIVACFGKFEALFGYHGASVASVAAS